MQLNKPLHYTCMINQAFLRPNFKTTIYHDCDNIFQTTLPLRVMFELQRKIIDDENPSVVVDIFA